MSGFRYFRPRSLTWWTGALAILSGVLEVYGVQTALGPLWQVIFQAGDPGTRIMLGLGFIGVGDKVERKLGGSLIGNPLQALGQERRDGGSKP